MGTCDEDAANSILQTLMEKEESDLAARLDRLARQQVAVEQGYADVEREWRQSRGLDTSGSAAEQ